MCVCYNVNFFATPIEVILSRPTKNQADRTTGSVYGQTHRHTDTQTNLRFYVYDNKKRLEVYLSQNNLFRMELKKNIETLTQRANLSWKYPV